MNIGFDAKRAFHNSRGLGNYSRNIISGLMEYFPEHKYFLYGNKPGTGDFLTWTNSLRRQVNIVEPPAKNKIYRALWRSYFVKNNIRKDKIDVYHGLSNEVPFKTPSFDTKFVVSVHDLLFLRFKGSYSKIDRLVHTTKIRHSCKISDMVLAMSGQTKADLINYLDIPREKIFVCYQHCSPAYYNPAEFEKKMAVKAKYKLPDEFLLFVGALVKYKNIERIIEAMSHLPADLKIPLVIVGKENSYKKELTAKIEKLNLAHRIVFLNYVGIDDMPAVYQLSKILVWPSLFEGFGIPIIEAMYSGIPVITSKEGCFTEVGGPGSWYVDPENSEEIADAIKKILTDERLYNEMQKTGIEYAQKFHIENTTTLLMELYKRLK